jgi:hypothetical protein
MACHPGVPRQGGAPEELKMENNQFEQGDEVFWNDPDKGICSGYAKFEAYITETVATVVKDGSTIEVFVHELS